jgi:hypothetical protein
MTLLYLSIVPEATKGGETRFHRPRHKMKARSWHHAPIVFICTIQWRGRGGRWVAFGHGTRQENFSASVMFTLQWVTSWPPWKIILSLQGGSKRGITKKRQQDVKAGWHIDIALDLCSESRVERKGKLTELFSHRHTHLCQQGKKSHD